MKIIWNIMLFLITIYPNVSVRGDPTDLDTFGKFILRSGKRFMDAKKICMPHMVSNKAFAVNSSTQRYNFTVNGHEYVLKTSKVETSNGKRHVFSRDLLSISVSVATNIDVVIATGVATEFNDAKVANIVVYGMETMRSSMPVDALVNLYDVTTVGKETTIFNYKHSKNANVPEWQNRWITLVHHNISIRITFKSNEHRKDYRGIAMKVLEAVCPGANAGEKNST